MLQFGSLALLLFSFSTCLAHPYSQNTIASTPQGRFHGVRLSEKVNAFLGIPFAQPPVGELRFKPPQKIIPREKDWETVINATAFGPVCFQFHYRNVLETNMLPTTPESEDCLSLNIFYSAGKRKSNLPVYIWSYGGAFAEGGASVPMYNPTDFVENHPDILVVTWNYRMNIFGFPNSPALPLATGQNLGIRDQRVALEWLRDNIAAFGGDPKRMVMGGQSSGVDTAHSFVYSYADDPIFSGLAIQSGLVQVINAATEEVDSEFVRVANIVGCANANRSKELDCMRTVDATALKKAISNETFNSFASPAGGSPMVDNATLFTLAEYAERGRNGQFAKIPTLMGNMNNEGDALLNWSPQGGINKTASDLITISLFNCPMALESGFRSLYKVPVWRYRYNGVFPTVTIYPWLRSYHIADVPFLMGTYSELVPRKQPQGFEIAASKYFQDLVATFIRDPVHGLEAKYHFPQFAPNTTSLIELFTDNKPSSQVVDSTPFDEICAHAPPVPYDAITQPPPADT